MRTVRRVRHGAALAVAVALALLAPRAGAAGADEVPVVTTVAELPAAPPHVWAELQGSLNDNRIRGNGLVAMPALQKYLDALYAKLKASAGVPDWPGAVYISADTTLNAHSSASGNLFLHLALIQSAETEDEIYSVLAHEFAHVYLNHQATYENHNIAENLRFAGTVLGVLAGKITTAAGGAVKWGLGDTIGVADGVAHDALIPVWQRDVETQADMAGVNLSMRSGYSYPAGFKTFLERLATIEQREADAAAAVAALAAANAAKTGAPAPVVKAERQTHASARERETQLTQLVAPLLPKPRPVPRKAPWLAALHEPETREILEHFALLPKIAALQAAGKQGDALTLAKKAASGATAGDATMLLALQDALRRTGASQGDQAQVLLRNKDWPERSWNVMRQGVLMGTLPAQPALAKDMLTSLFAYFGEPPAALPDMVAFYVQTNDSIGQAMVATRCLKYASYRKACGESAKTDQQRAQDEINARNRTEQLGNNAAEKVKKMFNWK